jgi:hypothetical protein
MQRYSAPSNYRGEFSSDPATGQAGDIYYNTVSNVLKYYKSSDSTWNNIGSGGGAGDVSSNTSVSVDSELVLFSGTGGKTVKRMSGSGFVKATSGVASVSSIAQSDVTDLVSALSGKSSTSHTHSGVYSPVGHTHVIGDVTNLQNNLDAKADLVSGKVPVSQIPSIAIGESFTAANEAAMLALVAEIGDIAVRTDLGNARYILVDDDPTVLGNWQVLATTGGVTSVNGDTGDVVIPVELGYAVSDESTALTTGTAKITFRLPFALTLTAVRASVNTAPTGSTLIVDINEGGASVLSTKLSIDAGEKTSVTAASPAVISDSALADDAEITIDIDQIGSTIAGKGLKVYLIGTRT